MDLETNPGFRAGTLPTLKVLTPVDPDADLLYADLVGALGVEAAVATICARVKELRDFAGFELSDVPASGCGDFLTYR